MAKIVTGLDIMRGKTSSNKWGNVSLMDFSPWHMIPATEKTEDWKHYIADYYEVLGWRQINRDSKKLLKNRKLVSGQLDMEDYIISPENDMADVIGVILPQEQLNPLQQFYPIIPNVIELLVGESLQKDNRVIIKAVDQFSTDERNQYKDDQFRKILVQQAISDKQAALIQMGIIDDPNDQQMQQQYQQEIQTTQQMAELETKFKKFRTQAEIWGQHVTEINRSKFDMDRLETEAFTEYLTNGMVGFHIDMGENDCKLEFVDNALSFRHKSQAVKYGSEGDYYGWFEYLTAGDIINKIGSRPDFSSDVADRLKDILAKYSGGLILPDYLKTQQGMFYDTSKKYPEGYINKDYVEAITEQNLMANLGIGKGQQSTTAILQQYNKMDYGDPRLFRMMRLYVRSQRKMGYLTQVDRSGAIIFQGWVDENWKQTIDPVYDNSIFKANTKKNLLYGEHVDWKWVNEWRHFIKISSNLSSSFWKQQSAEFEPIYLDGDPCPFQFKGKDDPFDIFPPFEYCEFNTKGLGRMSLADRMRTWQINYNIVGNKTLDIISNDLGIVLGVNKQTIPSSFADIGEFLENIRDNKIIETSTTKEQMEGNTANTSLTPHMVNLSSVQEAQVYFQLGQQIKYEAFESVGITRNRLGQSKAYETAGGIQSGTQFSETQTLKYFNEFFVEFMPRIYQRLLEATQYYCATSETAAVDYMNSKEDNVYLEISGKDLLHRHLHVVATATPRVKKIEADLKNLLMSDNTIDIDTRAEGIVAETATVFMEKLREKVAEKNQREQDQFQQQQETMRQQSENQVKINQDTIDAGKLKDQLDRESRERVALIGAMGHAQVDIPNAIPDSTDIINASLKQGEIDGKLSLEKQKVSQAAQAQIQQSLQKQQDNETKLKLKAEDVKIAKMNKN